MSTTLKCKWCEEPFEYQPHGSRGRRPDYCSLGCRTDRNHSVKAVVQRTRYQALKDAGYGWQIARVGSRTLHLFEKFMREAPCSP
jgi:hypothetical protein